MSTPHDIRLREARAQAWAAGQSFGPWVHGVDHEECLRIEARRAEILGEEAPPQQLRLVTNHSVPEDP
jgi:hypothetical protein